MSATPTPFDADRPGPDAPAAGARTAFHRLYRRDLAEYPATGRRMGYLAIVVITTVVLYYMLYIQYAVATSIITHFDMTYRYFVWISVIGNAVGAFASLVAGLADRWGRANLVVYGLLVASLLVFLGMPNAGGKTTYLVLFALVSLIEGIVLVATPALIRDFSPQVGRATAMGAWTMGPVIGSLVVTTVTSSTLDTSSWQDELRYSGIAGLVVFVIAIAGLRELSPALRDQIMVTLRDRALIEARAKGIDPKAPGAASGGRCCVSTWPAPRWPSRSSCCCTTRPSVISWSTSRPRTAIPSSAPTPSPTGTGRPTPSRWW